jgi:hypothetical protein
MSSLRRHLRLSVATWLVFQAASLTVLIPLDCCGAHRPAASSQGPSCHENTAATHCPTRAAGGTPCPMHRGGHTDAGDRSSNRCSMRGTCNGPAAAMVALLSNYGVLADSFAMLPDLHTSSAAIHTRENLITRLASPDPPPPRA